MPKAAGKPAVRTRHDRRTAKAQAATDQPAAANEPAAGPQRLPDDFAQLVWVQIEPDPLNPRKHFDEAAIDELADSIARDGLLENLVVRPGMVPEEGRLIRAGQPVAFHRLVAGERRWRAIGRLIGRGDWPKDRPILCKVVDIDDAGHRRIALVENLQRKDLRPIDEAVALKELMAVTGQGTAEIAQEIGFTQRFVQQRLQLLDLPEKLQDQVNAGELPIEDARTAVAILPKLPPVKQLELREGKIGVAAAKAWLEAQPKPLNLTTAEWVIALEVFDKVRRDPVEEGCSSTEVHADARFDETVKRLSTWPEYLLNNVSHIWDDVGETGRFQVTVGHDAKRQLEIKFGDITDEKVRLRALDSLYAELGVSRTPPLYYTPWLKGPFEVPESLRSEIEAARAKRSEEATRSQERDAARQREIQDGAARRQRAEAKSIAAVRAFMEPPWSRVAIEDAVADTGHPLPWRFKDCHYGGELLDANGELVDLGRQDALLRLVMCAMNAAADLPPATEAADGDNEDDDQVDLEDAIDAAPEADDVELTPALQRLAGAAPAAEAL